MTLADKARQWREQHGYIGKGGVIVIFDGNAQGWMDQLRNPEHWRPACIAIDESGRSWTAMNGNDQDGAAHWMPNIDDATADRGSP
jgi:hypothetical protein